MEISIVIVNYQTSHLLKKLLNILIEETKDLKAEIIIVDNSCSSEEKAQLLKLSALYPIKLVINRENLGYAGACEKGKEVSKGRYLLFMNPDVIPLKNSVSTLLKEAKKLGASVAVPRLFIDEECSMLHPPAYPFTPFHIILHTVLGRLFFHLWKRYSFKLWNAKKCTPINFITGAAFLIKREQAQFDTELPLYFEDAALSLYIKRTGGRAFYCPQSKMIHLYDMAPSRLKGVMWKVSERIYFSKYFSRPWTNLMKLSRRLSKSWIPKGVKTLEELPDEKIKGMISPNPELIPFAF